MRVITTINIKAAILSKHNPLRAAYLLGFASLASWMPMLNLWLEDRGLNGTVIGYLASIPWLVMLFVQPAWGVLADKYGKLVCFRGVIIAAALLFAIFPLAGSGILSIAVITLLMSLFNAPVLPLLDSIALDQVESSGDTSYSSIRFWGAPGYGLGALLTGWLVPSFGINVIFYLSAVFLLLTFLVVRKFIPTASSTKGLDLEFKDFRNIISNKILLIFLFVIVIVAIAQSASTFYLTIYMREIGASPETTGLAISVQALSELPYYFVAAWLLKRIIPGKVLVIAIFATSLRLFLYSVTSDPKWVILIETLNGLTWTLLWIAGVEFVNEIVPAQWRTTGQSLLWAAYFGAGSVLGNILSGQLYEQMPMQKVFAVNSAMVFVIAIMATLIFFVKRKPKLDAEVAVS